VDPAVSSGGSMPRELRGATGASLSPVIAEFLLGYAALLKGKTRLRLAQADLG
jgi:hypothetical protein